jgi:heterodisulfide reductase subunit A
MVIENPQRIEYDPEKCIGCDKCVYVCPYDAIEAKPLSTPYIHASKCKACGLCTVICPHLAMQIKDFESEQINSAIMEYGSRLKELKEKGKPVILVFCCQWAEFPALDRVENGFLKENAAIIEIPCFSALDPVHVLQALNIGFDGVLAIVCSDDDCKARESRDFVEEGIRTLKFALKKLNLDGKFVIRKTHPRYMERFEEKLEFFLEVLANG